MLDLIELIFLWTYNGSVVVGACLSQVLEQIGTCTIFAKNAQGAGTYQDLLLCGTLVMYDARGDTIKSLSSEEAEGQSVRWMLAAGSRQLRDGLLFKARLLGAYGSEKCAAVDRVSTTTYRRLVCRKGRVFFSRPYSHLLWSLRGTRFGLCGGTCLRR